MRWASSFTTRRDRLRVNLDLFDVARGRVDPIGPRALVLRGLALTDQASLLADLDGVFAQSPLRHMVTPGGHRMSVAMTNCGALGWVSDRTGYRYDALDPASGKRWPRMPASFFRLAADAAERAGFAGFAPDACLVNRYAPGARLTLHQDRNERDFNQPIVSVSLGIPAVFLFGGLRRADRATRVALRHGDVVVWGAADRMRFHGVLALKAGRHPLVGDFRINLTFRKAA
jgi:alkylated DNA repair protein (DNA oxidative demethylase)